MNILIRTAGGNTPKMELGLGHIFRTINLAKEFQNNNIFFLIEDFGGVKKTLIEHNFKKIIILKNRISHRNDIKKTLNVIRKNKIDLLIIDHFHLKPKFSAMLKKYVKVVVISDLKKNQYSADLLINGFVGYENQIIKNSFGTKCLLGPKYQILNKQFSNLMKHKRKKEKILTTFGGIDEKSISEKIFKEFVGMNLSFKLKMILGPVARKSKKFEELIKNKPRNFKIKIKTKNMRKEMESVKIGFCSGGLTTYEFASQNIPFVIICDDKHQLKTAREWHKKKIGVNLGLINKNTNKKIRTIMNELSKNRIIFEKGRKVIDGKGVIRSKDEILKMVQRTEKS